MFNTKFLKKLNTPTFKFVFKTLLMFLMFGGIALLLFFTWLLAPEKPKEMSKELIIVKEIAEKVQLKTGQEVSIDIGDFDPNPKLGKPTQVEIIIRYEPLETFKKEDVFNELIAYLEKTDWEKEELSIHQSGYYRATLLKVGFTILVEIYTGEKSNIASVSYKIFPN